jgi:hypothetical protein
MKKLLLIILLAGMGCSKPKEKTILLTQDEFITIYENGYMLGMKKGLQYCNDLDADRINGSWENDSINIMRVFGKYFK